MESQTEWFIEWKTVCSNVISFALRIYGMEYAIASAQMSNANT